MINVQDLIKTVRQLAQNNPDNTYEEYHDEGKLRACSYTKGECSNGTLGCIMGQAILALDPSYDFADKDQASIYNLIHEQLLLDPRPCNKDSEWLSLVQDSQDDSETWSNAVRIADTSEGEG